MSNTSLLDKLRGIVAAEPELVADTTALARRIRTEAGVISDGDVLDLLRRLRHDSLGLGVLEPILAQPGLSDVVVNGPRSCFIDRGSGLEPVPVSFASDAEVRQLATRLASVAGVRLDDAQPFADGRLARPDGTALRLHALLAPPSAGGTCISLRVLRQAQTSLDQLVASGSIAAEVEPLLRAIVERHASFLVIGGTGAGKTTLLSAMLGTVPDSERILVIEDTAELAPLHPHVVTLVARRANAEGRGEITMARLLQQSLRMRPDRIVVGEIRGAEVVDLLAALNTGHDGGAGTLHANSVWEVPARMEALAGLGGLDRDALHSQLAAAVHVVLAMERRPEGRRLAHIGLLEGNPVVPELIWSIDTGKGPGYGDFTERLGVAP
ncbi:TadA family conjugal transfer-associated ATPase [Corynebacterium striatum]|uniref:TadA family conjugal transfer-associated ATPase n=1 Tax=Corynebacterium striatum TaxID=43770 RepID=UPI001025B586|nr:TadA family conjugal transfer-associated ATPase [Corynebacterium striatum]MDC7106609.1 TadA family conjugal transfer-associated ATPase [Corynebacterium striatum]VFB05709.1 secretion ATPase [Corynebacterium striatum]HCD3015982.1 TadA family conjugal transfer-associated ATPase [Corynebacterium striatum]HCT3315872.1 TadA family conjugal transfer-associated ATPase [Corynebacterium striatum]